MFKSRKEQKRRELENIIGIVMSVFNGINEQSKDVFIPEDRKIFLSHLSKLLESESRLIDSPVSEVVGE